MAKKFQKTMGVVKNLFKALYIGGQNVLGGILLLLIVICMLAFFNPVLFTFLAFFWPKNSAKSLGEFKNDNMLGWLVSFLWAINIFARKCLGWRVRKAFFLKDYNNLSIKDQIRYWKETQDPMSLSPKAVNKLWNSGEVDKTKLLPLMKNSLTNQQFKDILACCGGSRDQLAIIQYLNVNTPSIEKLAILVDNATRSEDLVPILCFTVRKYGIEKKLLRKIYEDKKYEKILPSVENSLQIYGASQIIRTSAVHKDSQMFKNLIESVTLPVECQEILNVWQYEMYSQAGFKLDPSAISGIMSGNNIELQRLVLENENCDLPIVRSLVLSTPELFR